MAAAKFKPNCRSCQIARADQRFRKRVRYAAYKRESGDETLADIGIEFGISTPQIYNHVKKHLTDVQDSYNAAKEIKIAKKTVEFKANVQKELELSIDPEVMDTIQARPEAIVALDDYISQAAALISKGELKINATSFLQATKIRTDWDSKQQSNQTEFMKAIYAMTSGDKKKAKVIDGQSTDTQEDAGRPSEGEKQPQTIYGTITGSESP